MACFASEAELAAFLGKLDQDYAQYAAAVWQKGFRSSRQLSNARKHILLSAGLPELLTHVTLASPGHRMSRVYVVKSSLCTAAQP